MKRVSLAMSLSLALLLGGVSSQAVADSKDPIKITLHDWTGQ